MKYSILLLLSALLFVSPGFAAGAPEAMNYQGVLRDADGDPLEGMFDMRFRFFDAEALGNEILVDEHLAAGTGAVVVTGGLFNVALGAGDVLDGAGPGIFDSIGDVFGQVEGVWLEIEIDGETLSPRVIVLSAAYSLNTRLFQGMQASDFLDTTGTPQEKTGLLIASGGVDFGPAADDDLNASDVSALTGGGFADGLHTHALVGNAADSDLLDSLDSSQFLRSDTSDVFTSGTLTLAAGTVLDVDGETRLDGTLFMDFDGPDATQSIFFHDGGSPAGESLAWSEGLDRFTLSNTLRLENSGHLEVTGNSLFLNSAGPDTLQSIYFYDSGEPTGQSIVWDDSNGEFWVSSDSRVAGNMYVEEELEVEGSRIRIGAAGPDQEQRLSFFEGVSGGEFLAWDDAADRFRFSDDLRTDLNVSVGGTEISFDLIGGDANQAIRFFENGGPGGEAIQWDDAQDRFEITDELALQGTIRTGSTGGTPVTYNSMGGSAPASSDITSFSDLMVSADLEVGDQLYMGGDHYLEWSTDDLFYLTDGLHVGAEVGQNIIVGGGRLYLAAGAPGGFPTHALEYSGGTFTFYDDLDVIGTLTANSKNFVQNHPYAPDLEIVYTTLEGPEAATYTRGSARLVDGVARVPLDESFAWVTHPDLGLTASLTPRGHWADLYVVELTTTELVVAASPDSAADAAFDYMVMGLRVGYEESPVVRPRTRDGLLPEPQNLRAPIASRPDLARHTPLSRYLNSAASVFGEEDIDLSPGAALRDAIGTGPQVASKTNALRSLDAEAGVATARMAAYVPAADPVDERAANDDAVDDRVDDSHEFETVASSGNARDGGSTYEDEQGNLYARSFRPNSGGLDSVSSPIGEVTEGDVLVVDESGSGVRRADRAEDVAVIGIATGAATADPEGAGSVAFAVAGIVVCKVDAGYGSIRPGDLLVSSPTPGHAMRVGQPLPGTVLGKALEPLDDGTGSIRVLVVLR